MNTKFTTWRNLQKLQNLYRAETFRSSPRYNRLVTLLLLALKYKGRTRASETGIINSFTNLIYDLQDEINSARYYDAQSYRFNKHKII